MLVVVAFSGILGAPSAVAAQNCRTPSGTIGVQELRNMIARDQNAIRQLGGGAVVDEIAEFVTTAKAEKDRILHESLLGGIKDLTLHYLLQPKLALQSTSVTGVKLKNGIGSLGPGQVSTILQRLPDGKLKQSLTPSLRYLSSVNDKKGHVTAVETAVKVGRTLHETANLGTAGTTLEQAKGLFALAASVAELVAPVVKGKTQTAMASRAAFTVAVAKAIFDGSSDILQAFLLSNAAGRLSEVPRGNLVALQHLTPVMDHHIRTLQSCLAAAEASRSQTGRLGDPTSAFDPNRLTPSERAARERNEKIVAAETLLQGDWVAVCDPRLARIRFILANGRLEVTVVVRADVYDVGSRPNYSSCEQVKEEILGCSHPACSDETAQAKVASFDGQILRLHILDGAYSGEISLIRSGTTLRTKDVYPGFDLVFKKVLPK